MNKLYNEINAKCVEYCKAFLEKCPSNTWNINTLMQLNDGVMYNVSEMYLFCGDLYFKIINNGINGGVSNFTDKNFQIGEIMKVVSILPKDDKIFDDLCVFKAIADKYDIHKLLLKHKFICGDKFVTYYKVYNSIIEVMFEDGGSRILLYNNEQTKKLKKCLERSIGSIQKEEYKDCILTLLPDILKGFEKEEYEQLAESFADEIGDGAYFDESVEPSYVNFMIMKILHKKLLGK